MLTCTVVKAISGTFERDLKNLCEEVGYLNCLLCQAGTCRERVGGHFHLPV